MELGMKLDVLISRKNMKKVEFADSIGITYRALANYLAGKRTPRKEIFAKMAEALDTTVEFLSDERQAVILNSEERFIYNSTSEPRGISEAADYLKKTKEIFKSTNLNEEDKQALFACLTEIYFDEKEKAKKNY